MNTHDLELSSASEKLNGMKLFVTDAAVADFLLVVTSEDVPVWIEH